MITTWDPGLDPGPDRGDISGIIVEIGIRSVD